LETFCLSNKVFYFNSLFKTFLMFVLWVVIMKWYTCCTLQVQWPLSLVISRKALTKYQLIFRLLFHCKHVSRQLCAAWQIQQVWMNPFCPAKSV
jgi:hypothetical protein